MANLVIDIGNTNTKIAVFEQDELADVTFYQNQDVQIQDFLNNNKIHKAIISSVKKEQAAWETVLSKKFKVVYFNTAMSTGIKNHYLTPNTLGPDRLAGVIGAAHAYPAQNNLVIDGGTCITYDFVDADLNYYGGSISPGLKMRYKALNYYTTALPVVDEDRNYNKVSGDNTKNAITSGVQNGIKYELEGFINSYKQDKKQLNIILTGGDSIFFDTLLKNSIFAPYIKNEPYLVLKGLNAAITKHND
ncbi:type III pantothenate kinase [Mucilaginibacter sp.]